MKYIVAARSRERGEEDRSIREGFKEKIEEGLMKSQQRIERETKGYKEDSSDKAEIQEGGEVL